MKKYRLYVRKPGTIVWTYADTFEGALLAWMACRLAWAKGLHTRTRDAALHADVAQYARETAAQLENLQ